MTNYEDCYNKGCFGDMCMHCLHFKDCMKLRDKEDD